MDKYEDETERFYHIYLDMKIDAKVAPHNQIVFKSQNRQMLRTI